MTESKRFFTFLDVTDGPDGTKYCTTIVTLTRPEFKELAEGKKVLTCAAPITNRDQFLNKVLNAQLVPGGNNKDTIWVDVEFWNALADRFQKFLGERDRIRVLVCGRLSLREWSSEDGQKRQRVRISANNWQIWPEALKNDAPKNDVDDDAPLF